MKIFLCGGICLVKVAINGFGRIGRTAFRAMLENKRIDVVGINDLTDTATLAKLLRFDSIYGRFPGTVEADATSFTVNGKKILVTAERDPAKLPWKELGAEIVLESTGVFRTAEDAGKHLAAGAKKVIISAPPKDEGGMQFILNVNTDKYDPKKDHVLSMASCTTNCLAPIVKVLHDNLVIEQGFMTTIHAYTADQALVDSPHKDPRRARAAAINMVPTSTGAAKAITAIIPELKGKLDGLAVRVPTPTGSITDFTCMVKRETTADEINAMFKKAAQGKLARNLEYSTDDLVSTDIVQNPHGCIFDSKLTKANGRMVKVFGWYDNEWGYSSLLADFIDFIAKKGL